VSAAASRFRPVRVETPKALGRDRSSFAVARRYRGAGGFEAIIAEPVAEVLLAIARDATPNEAVALVLGREGTDAEGPYVVVLGIVPDAAARATPVMVATTHASEVETRSLARRLHPEAVPVGWFHTHPGHGLAFSATDRQTQATWTDPNALGILADATSRSGIAVYRGPKAERLELALDVRAQALGLKARGADEDRGLARVRMDRSALFSRRALRVALAATITSAVLMFAMAARRPALEHAARLGRMWHALSRLAEASAHDAE
jgi:proteasome lid subunit RPN8/RPN11